MNEEPDLKWRSEFHKALSNPVRLQIVEMVLDGEMCQCDIFPTIGHSQSTISSYLSQLVRSGILAVRRDGTRKLYSISHPGIVKALDIMRHLASQAK
jgi:ArsR family transcriptional regulator, cadmium/lead-responsive transcriptional repressor